MIHQFLPEIGKNRQQLAFAPTECQQGCVIQVSAPQGALDILLNSYRALGYITPFSAPIIQPNPDEPGKHVLHVELACPGRFGQPTNCLRKTLGDLDGGHNFPLCVNRMR